MAKRGEVFLVIDIGSNKISGVLGEIKNRDIIVHSSNFEFTKGITEGKVTDIEEAKRAILALIRKLTVKNIKIPREASVLITGPHLESRLSRGISAIGDNNQKNHSLETKHIKQALEQAKQVNLPQGREIVSIFPSAYYVDGEKVKRPYGMLAVRLEVDAFVLTGTSTYLRNIEVALLSANIKPKEYLYQPIMASFGVLDPEDRETGILLIDIGKDTTDIAVWQEGTLSFAKTIPTGGEDITLDIAEVLHLRRKDAEKVKIEHGTADPESVDKHSKVGIEIYGEEKITVSKREIAEIIQARVEEIFIEVRDALKKKQFISIDRNGNVFPSGISVGAVLVGGTSMLPGIREVGKRVLNIPCLTGKLRWQKIPNDMKTVSFASLWGAIEYKYRQIKEDPTGEMDPKGQRKMFFEQIKEFFDKNF